MSKGVSRNEANERAMWCRYKGFTYSQYWGLSERKLVLRAATKKISRSLIKAGAAASLAMVGITQLREELKDYQRREQENERKRVENEVYNNDC
jgi:hypothetical protein